MLIKITQKCSMGCTHCMNNALPTGKHMDFDTFVKAIDFQKKHNIPFCIISGGEPTEHPEFEKFLKYALQELPGTHITVTTNGVWLQKYESLVKDINDYYKNMVLFQVTSVPEYYPTKIDLSLPVFSIPNIVICREIESMYPQGRALDNNYPWTCKASRCTNIRLMAHQLGFTGLSGVLLTMAMKGFFCTPHINIDGSIILGESDLCPKCSHIDKTDEEILDDILSFQCHSCDFINKKLPIEAKRILGV